MQGRGLNCSTPITGTVFFFTRASIMETFFALVYRLSVSVEVCVASENCDGVRFGFQISGLRKPKTKSDPAKPKVRGGEFKRIHEINCTEF